MKTVLPSSVTLTFEKLVYEIANKQRLDVLLHECHKPFYDGERRKTIRLKQNCFFFIKYVSLK